MAKITAAVRISPRQQAEYLLDSGVPEIVAAFNLTNERPWAFDFETRQHAERILRELCELFETGRFESRKASAAQSDAHFQRFMRTIQGGENPWMK